MTQNLKTVLRRSALTLLLSAGLFAQATAARADARFQKWIADFYQTASDAGISKSTYQSAFSGVKTPDPEVLEKAAYQPEFKHTPARIEKVSAAIVAAISTGWWP